jgi:hypothetical protein
LDAEYIFSLLDFIVSYLDIRLESCLSFCPYHQATVTQRYRLIRPRIFDELGQGLSMERSVGYVVFTGGIQGQ